MQGIVTPILLSVMETCGYLKYPSSTLARHNLVLSVILLGRNRWPGNEVIVRCCATHSLSEDFNKLQIKEKLFYLQSKLSAVACR